MLSMLPGPDDPPATMKWPFEVTAIISALFVGMGGKIWALPRLTSPKGTLMDGAVVHSLERGRRGGGGEVGVVVEASGVVHSPAIL